MNTQKQILNLVFHDPSQIQNSAFPRDNLHFRLNIKYNRLINILLSTSKKNFPEIIGGRALTVSCTTKLRARRALKLLDRVNIIYYLVQNFLSPIALFCIFEVLEDDLDGNMQLIQYFRAQRSSSHLPQHMKDKLGI